MKRLCLLLSGLAILAVSPLSASGDPSPEAWITNLWVDGGEASWHSENRFDLAWDNHLPPGSDAAILVAHYRVRDAGGVTLTEGVSAGRVHSIKGLQVKRPGFSTSAPENWGEYTVEVWLELTGGDQSPPAIATLRLDGGRPGEVQPLVPGGWVGGRAFAHIRVTHPRAPAPLSGIRGYAVSIDSDPGGSPCSSAAVCTDSETDLREGIEGDSWSVAVLPEGTGYVHALAVSGSGMHSVSVGTAPLRVDATLPRTTLRGVPPGWSDGPVRLTASATDALSGMAAGGGEGPFTAIAVDGRPPSTAAGDSVSTVVSGDGVHRVEYYARDVAGNVDDGLGSNQTPASALVRIDTGAPAVSFVNRGDPADPELIEATVADSGSGPNASRGSIAVRPSGSRRAFAPLSTTVAGDRLRAHWDSEDFPTGVYEFEATAYDAVGNRAASTLRANGSRMVLANPVKTATELEAGLIRAAAAGRRCMRNGLRRRCRRSRSSTPPELLASRSIPCAIGADFGGRLITAAGAPLGGQRLQVIETLDEGAEPKRRLNTVTTAANGSFAVQLAPGPSRLVTVSFAGSRILNAAESSASRLTVRSGVRIEASARRARVGGRPVIFRGRVVAAGARIPRGGLAVQLQFRLPGLPWSEFRTVPVDRRGRFRYRYAFTDDDSHGVRFEFRAFLAARDVWPYEPAASPPVYVTGI